MSDHAIRFMAQCARRIEVARLQSGGGNDEEGDDRA